PRHAASFGAPPRQGGGDGSPDQAADGRGPDGAELHRGATGTGCLETEAADRLVRWHASDTDRSSLQLRRVRDPDRLGGDERSEWHLFQGEEYLDGFTVGGEARDIAHRGDADRCLAGEDEPECVRRGTRWLDIDMEVGLVEVSGIESDVDAGVDATRDDVE